MRNSVKLRCGTLVGIHAQLAYFSPPHRVWGMFVLVFVASRGPLSISAYAIPLLPVFLRSTAVESVRPSNLRH